MRRSTILLLVGAAATLIAMVACNREDRQLRPTPSAAAAINTVQVSQLHPGGAQIAAPQPPSYYEESAYAVSEGQKLFEQFNCVGCHAHGGGGMGPPLMDNFWIYGGEPQNIFATIMEGRPNGMPSWRGRIPEYQVWEIVAYIRSLSGQLPKDVAPGRSDEMSGKPSPEQTPRQKPIGTTGAPPEQHK